MKKAALYIHVPFCLKKCNYCDFYSIKTNADFMNRFVESVCREIEFYGNHPFYRQVEFTTLFFGGGTPSLLSAHQIDSVVHRIQTHFRLSSELEFTLEANPDTLTLNTLQEFKRIGVNRLSIGIQSFDDAELKTLGRTHTADQAVKSVDWARIAGFENINIDLIFAAPGQTREQWEAHLRRAIELNPQHISAYCLTVAPKTSLEKMIANQKLIKASETTEREMYLSAIRLLSQAGYQHYEISNFARPDFECRHNEMYWDLSPYLGLGPSAHSYWDDVRQWNVADFNIYSDKLLNNQMPLANSEKLTRDQQMLEFIFLHLRTTRGIDIRKFTRLFGISFTARYRAALQKLKQYPGEALFRYENNHLKLTPEGFVLFDEICHLFV